MSKSSNQAVDDTRQSTAAMNNARRLAMKAIKASSAAAKSGAGIQTAAAAAGKGVFLKVAAIALLVLLLLGVIIAGTSGSQMSNSYYLTMQGEKKVNKPRKADRKASLTDKGFTQEMTETLLGVVLEFKQESMKKTKEQMWGTYDKISNNPPGGVNVMDKEKTEESLDIPKAIANIDEGDFSGLKGDSNSSSKQEKINGEAITIYAKTFLKKGITYGLGKNQLVCSTYVNKVLEHFKAGKMDGMVPTAAETLPKDKNFKQIYRYNKKLTKKQDMGKLRQAYEEMLPGDIVLVGPLYSGSYHTKNNGKFSGSIGHVGIYIGNYQMIDCSSRWNGIGVGSIEPNYDKNGAYPVVGKAVYSIYRAKNVKIPKSEKKAAEKAAKKRWGSLFDPDNSSSGTTSAISASDGDKIAQKAIALAKEHRNAGWDSTSQTWAGGISCHGFVAQVYKACGYKTVYNIIHTHGSFWRKPWAKEHLGGKYKVISNNSGLKESQIQPGDIIVKKLTWGGGYHTGIYLGNGKVADSTKKKGPHVAKSYSSKYTHAIRVAPDGTSSGANADALPKKVQKMLKNGTTIAGKRLSKTQCKNALYVWNALKKEGITDEGAAGVLGNLTQEHSFNTDDVPLKNTSVGVVGGLGMCQWTGGRRAKLLKKKNPCTIKTQTAFLISELINSYKSVYKTLKTANNVDEASEVFRTKFEVGTGSEIRKKYARAWYKILKGVSGGYSEGDNTVQTIGITQGDMDLLAAYSVSLGNLMLSKQDTMKGFSKKWKKIVKIFHDPTINPSDKFKKINAIQSKMTKNEKKIFDCSYLIQDWIRKQAWYTFSSGKIISASTMKKAEKKRKKIQGKWNEKLQKEFERSILPDTTIEDKFHGTWEEKYIPYLDANGDPVKVYIFNTGEHYAGEPNLEKDLKEKLKKWFKNDKKATFYKYTFKENGASKVDDDFKTGTYEYYRSHSVFTYEETYTTESTGGKIITHTRTVGYMKPVIREKSIEEIMKDVFKIDPEDKYVNAAPSKKAQTEWKKYKKGKLKKEDLSKTTKRWITNRQAVSDLSKETTELLYDGKLPDATIDINGDFVDSSGVSGKFVSPLLCEYQTNRYGQFLAKRSYEMHPGLDMSCPSGNTIYACGDGVVQSIRNNCRGFESNSYGNYVVISHGGGITTRYAHMLYGSVKVKKGQKIKKCTPIGKVGNTGQSSGPHLHLEFRKNGTPKNPASYIKGLKYKAPSTGSVYSMSQKYKMKW